MSAPQLAHVAESQARNVKMLPFLLQVSIQDMQMTPDCLHSRSIVLKVACCICSASTKLLMLVSLQYLLSCQAHCLSTPPHMLLLGTILTMAA